MINSKLVTTCGMAYSQQVLSVEEALHIALENNYSIQSAKNTQKIAENNTSIYNQDILPTVSASGQAAYNNLDVLRSESDIETKSDNINYPYGASALVSYTIFNGSRVHNIEQLKERYNLSDLQLRQTIENVVYQVYNTYYLTAELEKILNIRHTNLKLSKRRLLRANYAVEYGVGNQLDRLNAEVDVNTDSTNWITTTQTLANAKRNLNVLLGQGVLTKFIIDGEVDFLEKQSLLYFSEKAQENNADILITDKNLAIEELKLKIAKAGWLPTLDANGGYSWNKTVYEKSLLDFQRANGWNAGLNLRWNIFDGGRTKTNVANAWENYQNALLIYEFKKTNLATSEFNYKRPEEQYKIGNINSVTLRTAQLNLLNTKLSLLQAKYDAKLAEIELLRLSRLLVEEDGK